MNRADLKKLAKKRLKESKILLDKRKYSGAYYLCGYVIEYALKAYFAKQIRKSEFPVLKVVKEVYTHDLVDLMKASGLQTDFKNAIKSNKKLETHWATVKDWSPQARYNFYKQKEAEDLYKAISDPSHGVLQWIKAYW